MQRMTAILVLGLVVAGVSTAMMSGSASAKSRPPVGLEPVGSVEWPKVAAQLAKNIAGASFAHDYDRVWGYLHPTYRQAVSKSRWSRCQGLHPVAPPSIRITKISVASATELPIALSLLGRRNVQEIELVVQYKTPAAPGPQLAILSTFWLKQDRTWRAVWLSDEYQAYNAGKCYIAPQGATLY